MAAQRRDDDGEVQAGLARYPEAEDLAAGRLFAFIREALAHRLF
jgi:hypothetical protein